MGIVPKNEYLLGAGGATVIRRFERDINILSQPIAFFEKNFFENRVVTKIMAVVNIGDGMASVEVPTDDELLLWQYKSINTSCIDDIVFTTITCDWIWPGADPFSHGRYRQRRHPSVPPARRDSLRDRRLAREAPVPTWVFWDTGWPPFHQPHSIASGFGVRFLEDTAGKGVVPNSLIGVLLIESWRHLQYSIPGLQRRYTLAGYLYWNSARS